MARPDCGEVLIPTNIDVALSYEQQLAVLKIIQSESALEKARKASGSGLYGGLSLGGSYSAFDEARNKHLEQENFQLSVHESQRLAVSFLPEYSADAWLACVKKSLGGLVLYAAQVTKDAVTLVASWNPPPRVKTVKLTSAEVRGSTIGDMEFKTKFPLRWETEMDHAVIVDRKPDQDLRIALNLDGYGDHVLVPAHKYMELPPKTAIEILACHPEQNTKHRVSRSSFTNLWCHAQFGGGVASNTADYAQENIAEYRFWPTAPGEYTLKAKYGFREHEDRSVSIWINDKKEFSRVLGEPNDAYETDVIREHRAWVALGAVQLKPGENKLAMTNRKLDSGGWSLFPHIYGFLFEPNESEHA
jgi:hypothetical protein